MKLRPLGFAAALIAAIPAFAADARQEILRADAEFCALAQKAGVVPAIRAYSAPDAAFLDVAPSGLRGPDAAALHMDGLPPGAVLRWEPHFADASASGDFGYSRGTYELTLPRAGGPPVRHTGRYLTIWKRQPDGKWKLVFDTGAEDRPPPRPEP
jgi:ketosteroid isomerase-like protein